MEKLRGKKILIIGATGSIGRETARLLHESGATLYITSTSVNKLAELHNHLNLSVENGFICDVTNRDSVESLARYVQTQTDFIDVLINASGIGIIKPLEQLSEEEFELSIQTNLVGVFRVLKAFLPSMKQAKKGLVIHIPGVLSKAPMFGASAYSASKYGLEGMIKSIREELKHYNIRFTNLVLGGTDSEFWDKIELRVQRDKMINAQEVAKTIWFLCQQPSSGVVSEMVLQPFNHQVV